MRAWKFGKFQVVLIGKYVRPEVFLNTVFDHVVIKMVVDKTVKWLKRYGEGLTDLDYALMEKCKDKWVEMDDSYQIFLERAIRNEVEGIISLGKD